jgi:DegV family protein with EDD domain
MQSFVIGACSTSDLPQEYIVKNEIAVVKFTFMIDHKEYKDGDMDAHTFFDLERDGHLPTTSQVTPDEYMSLFDRILSAGQDLLYIAFSSGLSGSCNNAKLVAEELRVKYPDRKLYVIDSLCASLGQGLLVDYAVKMRTAGKSIDETAKWIEANKLGLNHWFTVDSLSHLRRGGRVTGAAAFVGNLLHIKPVLNVDYEGHLIPREKEQGRKKALRCLIDKMSEYVYKPEGQSIFISHGDDIEAAEKVAAMVKERFPQVGEIMISMLGTVIGAHSGAGTVALFFMGKSR